MDFIQTANKQVDKFGTGKHGFSAGNPTGGIPATFVSPEWCDNIQQELINVIEGAGLTVNPAVKTQVYQAIQAMIADAAANDYKASVRFTTTANIVLSGLGTQAGGDWAAPLTAGDRILTKGQAVGSENGIYIAAAGAWTRATDADGVGELTSGAVVVVEEGTQADSLWELSTDGPITIGITAMTWVRKDASASAVSTPPPVRQTVLSGPVDTNGFSAFGGVTGGTTVAATGTLKPTASFGADNRTGSIVNPSWTGLSVNGTMYLYIDIAADGACTTGSTALAPTYRWGGADVVTNGQNTFNIQEMTMKVGNGASAAQVYRVFIGEVTVAGGVVTAITWYALMGRYSSAQITFAATTAHISNHNLGVIPMILSSVMQCKIAELGYSPGDEVKFTTIVNSGAALAGHLAADRKTVNAACETGGPYLGLKTAPGVSAVTAANWYVVNRVSRGW